MKTENIYIIIGIIIFCGIIGGIGSSLKEMKDNGGRFFLRNIIFGILASITVPLFLNLVSSDILKLILDRKEANVNHDINYFIFSGFCVIVSYSSIQYLNLISSRVVQNLKEDYANLKVENNKMKQEVERISEVQKTVLVYDGNSQLETLKQSSIVDDAETKELMKTIYNPEKKFTPVEKVYDNISSIENEKIKQKIEELKDRHLVKEIQLGDGVRAVALSDGAENLILNNE